MTKIIDRNTLIPAKKTQTFSTYQDQQTKVNIAVFEGERALVKDNNELGKFELIGIPLAARGVPQIDVTFEIDANSILTVTAHERGTDKHETISITNDKGRLTEQEIQKILDEAKKFEAEDAEAKSRIDSRNQLENYIYQMRNTIEDSNKLAGKLSQTDIQTIQSALSEHSDWLQSNEQSADSEEF